MAIYQPYFYIIQDVRNGIYYAGAKWAQDANPSNFMVEGGYETSSETIRELIREHGLDNFIVRKIKIFATGPEAYQYEKRFLQKVNARKNPRFYNKHNNEGAMDHESLRILTNEKYGVDNISQTEHWRQTVIPKMKKPKTEKHKENLRKAQNKPETKKKHSENMKKTRAKQSKEKRKEIGYLGGKNGKGSLWWNDGTNSIKSRTNPGDGWKRGRIKTWQTNAPKGIKKEVVTCPHCNKSGGKPVMTRYHFENCKEINR